MENVRGEEASGSKGGTTRDYGNVSAAANDEPSPAETSDAAQRQGRADAALHANGGQIPTVRSVYDIGRGLQFRAKDGPELTISLGENDRGFANRASKKATREATWSEIRTFAKEMRAIPSSHIPDLNPAGPRFESRPGRQSSSSNIGAIESAFERIQSIADVASAFVPGVKAGTALGTIANGGRPVAALIAAVGGAVVAPIAGEALAAVAVAIGGSVAAPFLVGYLGYQIGSIAGGYLAGSVIDDLVSETQTVTEEQELRELRESVEVP